jgi:hypothetical protein
MLLATPISPHINIFFMPVIVFKIITLIFKGVEGLVLYFPASPTADSGALFEALLP